MGASSEGPEDGVEKEGTTDGERSEGTKDGVERDGTMDGSNPDGYMEGTTDGDGAGAVHAKQKGPGGLADRTGSPSWGQFDRSNIPLTLVLLATRDPHWHRSCENPKAVKNIRFIVVAYVRND